MLAKTNKDDRRVHGCDGHGEMSAVTDNRPAIVIEDLPVTCVGYLPEDIREKLRLRDAGLMRVV